MTMRSSTLAPSGGFGAAVKTDLMREDKAPFEKLWIWAAASEFPANSYALVLRSVHKPGAATIYMVQNRTDRCLTSAALAATYLAT